LSEPWTDERRPGVPTPDPWYVAGLQFQCTRCGHCCTGGPGNVQVTDDEIRRLAHALDVSVDEFTAWYTRRVHVKHRSLREKSNHDCVFYDRRRGCTVYEHRPRQCRTWPFWQSVVRSPQHWAEEAEHCRGMNSGPLHSAEAITAACRNDGTFGSVTREGGRRA